MHHQEVSVAKVTRAPWLALLLCAIGVTACGGGGGSGSQSQTASVAPSTPSVSQSATPAVGTTTPPGTAPSDGTGTPAIAGKPAASVSVGTAFTFTPSVSALNTGSISFSVQNKPSWAAFDAATGTLAGTPTAADVNTYSNIVITASDGVANAAMTPFSIAVTQIGNGSVSLSWVPSTENTDGTAVAGIGGYRIHYGTDADSMDKVVSVDKGNTAYVVENLAPATWHFAITALAADGTESDYSNVVSKATM